VLFSGVDMERVVFAAGPIGLMQASCDTAFEYVHQRKQFGQRIGEFQLMQAKIADMYTSLAASRSYLYSVARSADGGNVSRRDCASVALYCSERATQVALQAIQCLGEYNQQFIFRFISKHRNLKALSQFFNNICNFFIDHKLNFLPYKIWPRNNCSIFTTTFEI